MGYQLVKSINAAAIARFHDDAMSVSGEGPRAGTGFKAVWRKIEEDHRCNVLLRSERERAQRHDSRDADRAARRRRIERYEALRHHAVAAMDRELLNVLGDGSRHPGARFHAESAGTLIDRLSLLAIEIHYARNGSLRSRTSQASLAPAARAKLVRLVEQRMEVARALDELMAGAVLHILYFRAYQPQSERDGGQRIPVEPGARTMIAG
ncbi:MAG TPA: DUF4254 domain-containing protein [Burkholderiales bacterium]|nr:DUF4254 domain-containing protein [Burkholderiales bacterium]